MAKKKELFKPGQRIKGTMLTVIEEVEPRGKYRYYLCQCDCGNTREVASTNLKNGKPYSCGCSRRKPHINKIKSPARTGIVHYSCDISQRERLLELSEKFNFSIKKKKYIDLAGMKIGKLLVISEVPKRNNKRMWLCQCDCGSSLIIKSQKYLTIPRKMEKSCGCVSRAKDFFQEGQRVKGTLLTIINEVEPVKGQRMWLCQCDCGSDPKVISQSSLLNGTKSCGCTSSIYSNNRTGVKGVSYIKSKKRFKAAIVIDGKQIYGGIYDTLEEATAARKELEEKYNQSGGK